MIRFFKEIYLTAFTIGFKLRAPPQLGGGWGPTIDAGKGVGVVWFIEFCFLMGGRDYIEVLNKVRYSFDSSLWVKVAMIFALYIPNYYILVTRGHGIEFERGFTHLKKSRKIVLIACFSLLVLTAIAFLNYSRSANHLFFFGVE